MIDSEIEERLRRSHQNHQEGDYNAAAKDLIAILNNHPDNFRALYAFSLVTRAAENFGVSLLASRRCFELAPNHPHVINSLGQAHYDVGDEETAEQCYLRAFEMEPHAIVAQNLGNLFANRCEPERAIEWFEKARVLNGAGKIANNIDENEAHALLALRRWNPGWRQYVMPIGKSRHRPDKKYGDAMRWTPLPTGKTTGGLVIHGEQGLGDEVMFASCIPDVLTLHDGPVILDVQPRLEGLFKRSFPWAEVHGTRHLDTQFWMARDDKPLHKTAVSRLPLLFRLKDEQFPGKPYLHADPLRRSMYRALLDGIRRVHPRRPKFGLAWTGGMINTGRDWRSLDLERLKPLLDAFPSVDWVSLQYMDAPEAMVAGVHHFPFAVQTKDYDDTAALVAELDAVVTVQTSVVHLAGGLGKRCHVLVSNRPIWRYGRSGDRMLWYESVKLHRQTPQNDWKPAIDSVITDLKDLINAGDHHRKLPSAAA